MTETTDPHWWRPFREGDLNALGQLIERHQDDVFAIALATVIDRGLAEDVAQETFIAAFHHRGQLRAPTAVGGWLAAIARNLGRDLLRARRRERLVDLPELEIVSEADSPSHQLDHSSLCRSVRRALDRLPSRYREVLILYYSCERSVDSIARSLGLTVAATMQRLSRGRRLVQRHGVELHEFVPPARAKRSLAVAVLALLAIRTRAEAAPLRIRASVAKRAIVGLIAGLIIVPGLVGIDQALGQDPIAMEGSVAVLVAPPTTPQHAASVPRPATVARPVPVARPILAATPILAARPIPESAPHREAPNPALTGGSAPTGGFTVGTEGASSVRAESSLPLPPSNVALATTDRPCCAAPAVQPTAPRPERWDQVNGFLETAALPRPGDVSYDTVGMVMMVRAGLTSHVAAHLGMTVMDVDQGTSAANVNPAVGGGIKIGGSLQGRAAIAVLAEGAREVNVKSLTPKEGWIGRAYAAVTLGTPRLNTTLIAGAISEFDGNQRWRSPMFGITSQLGWDDRLAFILEAQRFTTPKGTVKGTSVLAVRFRSHEVPRNFVGVDRVRLDVGALLLEKTEGDLEGLPWLQVGLGW